MKEFVIVTTPIVRIHIANFRAVDYQEVFEVWCVFFFIFYKSFFSGKDDLKEH